jgi:hypothetical protein
MNRLKQLLTVLLVLGLVTGCASRQTTGDEGSREVSGEPIAVQKEIEFAEGSNVREAVKSECELQTMTPEFVEQFGRQRGLNVQLVEDLGTTDIDRKFVIEITEVHAPGGGAFSGPKWMVAEGILIENGREVASVRSRRNTTGGYFAAYKGTCDIVGRCSEAIGDDFARWLENPEDGARLGDL